ncbi:hypothetical protein LG314_01130 [Agrococcus terreus]|uniref:hypothetical protein n=1 Tax=Agrococcus terreus TaxID=574649 RepID=UPI00384B48C7
MEVIAKQLVCEFIVPVAQHQIYRSDNFMASIAELNNHNRIIRNSCMPDCRSRPNDPSLPQPELRDRARVQGKRRNTIRASEDAHWPAVHSPRCRESVLSSPGQKRESRDERRGDGGASCDDRDYL